MKEFGLAALIIGFGFLFAAVWVPGIWLQSLITATIFILVGASVLGSKSQS